LREENRLTVENSVLRIFGPKREEYGSRRMRWVGHVARMGAGRSVYRVLVGRPKGKRPLQIHRRRWEVNIKMDLKEIGINGVNWIQVAQDRVWWQAFVIMVMNLQVP
jgi:hypothetical protein